MPNLTNTDLQPSIHPLPWAKILLRWIVRYAAVEIAVVLALAIAAYFLGRHVFDLSVPVQGDVRSHIFKIELLQNYLTHFSWPQWNPYWYHGIPEDQFYPPGFYFLGAVLSFIVKNGVIAYKILLLMIMIFIGLIMFVFSRRLLKFDSQLSMWCLLAYEASTPLLINFMYGEGPNLLGWCTTLTFLVVYIDQAIENRTKGLYNIVWPGLILGAALLIHPFPVIFAGLAIAAFHIIWLIHKRTWREFVKSQLPYLLGVAVVGSLIGMYYWLPAFLTLHESSPIYSYTKFEWPGGNLYLLVWVFLGLAVYLATRFKIRGDIKLDFIFICFAIASALGFGATDYLPFGLGSLVQEFRFASIVIPFFSILLIVYPLKFKIFRLRASTLILALCLGFLITALIFGLSKSDVFIAGFKAIKTPDLDSYRQLVSKQFSSDFPNFALNVFPCFTALLFLAFSLGRKTLEPGKNKPVILMAGGACLVFLTIFVPYVSTYRQVNLNNLGRFVTNYIQPGYAQIMNSANNGRLIVPLNKGYLTEGDSPVTFGRQWGVETVNGPYNQGDPKFFKFTVHLEWEERWLNYIYPRENLMQESAAKNIFIRGTRSLPANLNGMQTTVINSYGKLVTLNEEVAHAVRVTPILADVNKIREVTEFFNILLPSGYKLVLTDLQDVPRDMTARFDYVMVDDSSKIAQYSGKTVFLLKNTDNLSVSESQGVVNLNLPYLTYSNKVFYHGDIADGYMWGGWDSWQGSQLTPELQDVLNKSGQLMSPYIDKLNYSPVNYQLADTTIRLDNAPGFTLVKDTYFPYWKADSGTIMPTSQGFMLLNTDSSLDVLNYRKPGYYLFGAAFSVLGLIGAITVLLVLIFSRKTKQAKA